ncbi:MAG TPA: TonB-dependent receptor [Longimicrobium sp.]|nr:TonB-dependent receptor [Longimicrobium sp.]
MRRVLLFLCALALVAAVPLPAQVLVDGVLRDDDSGRPIADARIELIDSWGDVKRARITDSLGNFRMPMRRLGVYRLRVRARGYAPVTATLVTEAYVYHNVELRVRPSVALGAPLTLLARAQVLPSPVLEAFHARLRNSAGRFFSREHVEMLRPAYVSDLIATAPGVAVRRDGEERLLIAQRVTSTGVRQADCNLRVYLDGEVVNPRLPTGELGAGSVDNTVDQTMVEGIEIYPTAATVPTVFSGNGAPSCGAVAVWTKGGRMLQQQASIPSPNGSVTRGDN